MTVPYRPSSGISPGRDHPLASGPPRLAGQPAMCQAWRPATCVAGLPSCLALFSGAPVCCVDCSGGGDFGAARTRHTASAGGPHRLHAPRAAGRRAAALVAFSPSVRAWGTAACGWRRGIRWLFATGLFAERAGSVFAWPARPHHTRCVCVFHAHLSSWRSCAPTRRHAVGVVSDTPYFGMNPNRSIWIPDVR